MYKCPPGAPMRARVVAAPARKWGTNRSEICVFSDFRFPTSDLNNSEFRIPNSEFRIYIPIIPIARELFSLLTKKKR